MTERGYEGIVSNDMEMFLAKNKILQKRELSSKTVKLCDTFYSTLRDLKKDFPGANFDNLCEMYKDKFEALKTDLIENNLFSEKIGNILQNTLYSIKTQEPNDYINNRSKLLNSMNKFL